MSSTPKLFALFIDGDNINKSPAFMVSQILKKIAEHNGNPIIKRVYLNDTSSASDWTKVIRQHALHKISVPQNVKHKNAVDIALVIDAMDLLCRDKDIQGFCIVANDSDYTRLAQHLVAKKKYVLGMSEVGKVPQSFESACSDFEYLDDMPPSIDQPQTQATNQSLNGTWNSTFDALFVIAYENVRMDDENWVPLIDVKKEMMNLDEAFKASDYRNTILFRQKVEDLAKSYPLNIVKINPRLEGEQTVHDIWVNSDIFKLVDAYNRSTAQGNKGFVLFSVIGTELGEYKKYDSGFSYCDNTKLTDAILKIEEDYPWLIKTDKEETVGKPPVYSVRVKK